MRPEGVPLENFSLVPASFFGLVGAIRQIRSIRSIVFSFRR